VRLLPLHAGPAGVATAPGVVAGGSAAALAGAWWLRRRRVRTA
jgi:hypothetical protein